MIPNVLHRATRPRTLRDEWLAAAVAILAVAAWYVALALWDSAEAAYPAHDPCVKVQHVDVILGAWSSEPVRCPPSSFAHYMAWAHRRPEWIEAPGSGSNGIGAGTSPGIGAGHGAGTVGGPR